MMVETTLESITRSLPKDIEFVDFDHGIRCIADRDGAVKSILRHADGREVIVSITPSEVLSKTPRELVDLIRQKITDGIVSLAGPDWADKVREEIKRKRETVPV